MKTQTTAQSALQTDSAVPLFFALILVLFGCGNSDTASAKKLAPPVSVNGNTILTLHAPGVKRLIALNDLVCILRDNDQVYCWGPEATGDLQLSQLRQVDLGSGNTAADIFGHGLEAGGQLDAGYHACALLKNGGVRCWAQFADNVFKDEVFDGPVILELKPGSSKGQSNMIPSYPLKAEVLKNMDEPVRLFLNANVICGLSKKGKLYCPHDHLRFLNGKSDIKDAYFGEMLSCLHLQSGKVECFDMRGEGGGPPITISFDGELTPKSFTARIYHYHGLCSIDLNDEVACWDGIYNPDIKFSNIHMFEVKPIKLPVKSKPISVVMVDTHTCVLFENGKANCWGQNYNHQLSLAKTKDAIKQPGVTIDFGEKVKIISMALSPGSNCFLLDNQQVKCLGKLYVPEARNE
jgi:alpha-tubulin suppressor-like RCC1 family protein